MSRAVYNVYNAISVERCKVARLDQMNYPRLCTLVVVVCNARGLDVAFGLGLVWYTLMISVVPCLSVTSILISYLLLHSFDASYLVPARKG